MPDTKFHIQRVYVWSGDAAPGGTGSRYSIQLKNPVNDVVFIELLNTTLSPNKALIQIEDWGESTTSSGRRYWRCADAVSNQRSNNEIEPRDPSPLRYLQISYYNFDGTLYQGAVAYDGGTIYGIGDTVSLNDTTWECIQYAPAGYGPFGGYIGVYWTQVYTGFELEVYSLAT